MTKCDAILIPGGGLVGGELPAYVRARLDAAALHQASYWICLSAGTTHKPLPLDAASQPIYESAVSAKYLTDRGVEQRKVLVETNSYDTIGNAYFARTLHIDVLRLRRIHVVTSAFHVARTEAIFRWIFGVEPLLDYELSFEATPDVGIAADVLAERRRKETASLISVLALQEKIRTAKALHEWLYSEHAAYAWSLRENTYREASGKLAETY